MSMLLNAATGVAKVVADSPPELTLTFLCAAASAAQSTIKRIYNPERSQSHGSPPRSSHGVQTDEKDPAPGGQGHGNRLRSSDSSFHSCGVQTDGAALSPGGQGHGSPPRSSGSSFLSHGVQTDQEGPVPGEQGHGSPPRSSGSSFPSNGVQTDEEGPAPGGQGHGSPPRSSGSSFQSCGVQTDGGPLSPGGQGHGNPSRSSGSSFTNCGVQTDQEGLAPDHGTHSESPRRERAEEDQGEPREVHAPPEACLIKQQQKKRREGAAVMFFTIGVIAIAAIVAIYVFSKENRNKNEYDNERTSLHSNCRCLGGREKEAAPSCPGPKDGRPSLLPNCHSPGLGETEEEADKDPPCLDSSTKFKTESTEENEGSTELPFKSTDMSQKILEELHSLKSQMSKKDDDTERDLKLEFRRGMKEMKQSVAQMTTELKQINEKVQMLDEKTDKMDRARQRDLDPFALPEIRRHETCLRFRAIPEQPNENIRGIIIEILTTFLERQSSEMDLEVDQVYRVNSSITKQRNLPRDVIVHFVRKQTRDQVLQQHYEITLKIEVKNIVVLKEIPERILYSGKEYGSLADKVKHKILFIMERSKETTFTFEQRKFQANSIQKTEEFLHKYKRELEETGELEEEKSEATLEYETIEEWKRGEDKDDEKKICSSVVDFTKLLA